jgi:hypothetical protein
MMHRHNAAQTGAKSVAFADIDIEGFAGFDDALGREPVACAFHQTHRARSSEPDKCVVERRKVLSQKSLPIAAGEVCVAFGAAIGLILQKLSHSSAATSGFQL